MNTEARNGELKMGYQPALDGLRAISERLSDHVANDRRAHDEWAREPANVLDSSSEAIVTGTVRDAAGRGSCSCHLCDGFGS